MITKLLIANRGEIAVRVIRTARALGIRTVAVYSDADARALHAESADEAIRIGPANAAESYLNITAILDAAKATGADAIHPGYGFLSENPEFVDAVESAGLIFVGPSAKSIRAMGLKDKAKFLMETAGVPVVPGYHGERQDAEFLREQAGKIGFPVLIKARAGGGGKGMRLVESASDFDDALTSARREAKASFGDPDCLIEKFVTKPRHIEIQVFGDHHGTVVHLFERDCSLQRRHQKVIEEAPAPGMTPEMREAMGAAAVAAAKAVDYVGAGTVEFIVDASDGLRPDRFWFMEMNTRLQVEHPVTEAVTGLDLVALQLRTAEGRPLPFRQADLAIDGHAIEARLYAEEPRNGFLPTIGQLDRLSFPAGVRVDSGVVEGDVISPFYDPMIAKLIVQGEDRDAALRKMAVALKQTNITGTETNCDFLGRLVQQADFVSGAVDTGLIDRSLDALVAQPDPDAGTFAAAALAILVKPDPARPYQNFRLHGPARQIACFAEGDVIVESHGERRHVSTPLGLVQLENVQRDGDTLSVAAAGLQRAFFVYVTDDSVTVRENGHSLAVARRHVGATSDPGSGAGNAIMSPMPGRIVDIAVEPGASVAKGDRLIVLEAMKMEHSLRAPRDGTVADLAVSLGDQVEQGAILLSLDDDPD